MMRFVYLAEPIDAAGADYEGSRRRLAIDMLNGYGVGVFRPRRAFSANAVQPGPEINEINTCALKVCDAVLAFLPSGTPTIGVPIEIEQALVTGKPVAVVTDNDGAWALQRPEPHFGTFESYRSAVDWLALQKTADHDSKSSTISLPFKDFTGGQEVTPVLPFRGYADDAGLDLTVLKDTPIPPGEFRDVPTGVACGFPPGVWGLIIGRSSTLRQRGLMVNQGVIDPGYRGELFCGCFNLTVDHVVVKAGDRIAQMLLLPSLSQYQPAWTGELPASHDGRDTAGFGSTGGVGK